MAEFNYKHLHYFWMVAKEGSIAKASEKLHITPQTISGQLSVLEDRMGHPLFLRQGKRFELSETGRVVLRYADEIFELGRELSQVLRGAPATGPSEFNVSAASALPKTIVYKILEPAMHLSADISLISKEGSIETILAELAVHEVDMVLTDTPLTSAYSIKAYNHLLGETAVSFFAAPSLAKRYARNFPHSLNNAPMLLPTRQNAIRERFDHWADEAGIFPTVRAQFEDSALMKSFGQAGHGIFFMPAIIADQVCENFNVRVIGQIEDITQRFYAITPERKVKHPAVAAICETARSKIFTV